MDPAPPPGVQTLWVCWPMRCGRRRATRDCSITTSPRGAARWAWPSSPPWTSAPRAAAPGRCRRHCAGSGDRQRSVTHQRPPTALPAGYARLGRVSYAGDITPEQAWKLLGENPEAVLVDVRTDAEWRFVGVPDLSSLGREVVYIEWNSVDGTRNDNFVADLTEQLPAATGDRPVIFLCRSGNRSIGAAEVATGAGIAPAYNVLDGFEGHLDANGHRGETGWGAMRLRWKQLGLARTLTATRSAPPRNCPKAWARPLSESAAGC